MSASVHAMSSKQNHATQRQKQISKIVKMKMSPSMDRKTNVPIRFQPCLPWPLSQVSTLSMTPRAMHGECENVSYMHHTCPSTQQTPWTLPHTRQCQFYIKALSWWSLYFFFPYLDIGTTMIENSRRWSQVALTLHFYNTIASDLRTTGMVDY